MSEPSKLETMADHPLFQGLVADNRSFLERTAGPWRLTQQDLVKLVGIATDLEMWDCGLLEEYWDEGGTASLQAKDRKKEVLSHVEKKWIELKEQLPHYADFKPKADSAPQKIVFRTKEDDDPILGACPVFSNETRCCNLQTLDTIINCGYGCSYCSIQSFYHNDEIVFQGNLAEKLDQIQLDPEKTYHIGTGQSSDSLLWGNRNNTLKNLFDWVEKNPNVILELKTKSSNIEYLLKEPVPGNVIATWSVNAESIVKNEEHRTASLTRRLEAAQRLAEKGILVGFHLHPVVAFEGWRGEYGNLVSELQSRFDPQGVALVSLGTLTFIKPVMKKLRQRKVKSKILQMPFEDAAGKSSYPLELKRDFFKYIYDAFAPWHGKTFFYLCMEDPSLWKDVFGYQYSDNEEFEQAMTRSYREKINAHAHPPSCAAKDYLENSYTS